MDRAVKTNIAALTPSLFQADELAPYEYEDNCRRKDRYGPEERLLFAILEDAISCYRTYLLAPREEDRELFSEAESWIFDDGAEFISFNNICETLKIDPGYVRRGLRAWREWQAERTRRAEPKPRWRTVVHGQRALRIGLNGK
jgi:hypothetical protein